MCLLNQVSHYIVQTLQYKYTMWIKYSMIIVSLLLNLISKLVSINSNTIVMRYASLTGHCANTPLSLNIQGVTLPGSVNYEVGQTYYFASKLRTN